mmetsp:Transcript_29138/g.96767  ORF Transcript_29138/g.96767 Transcript_29138/m.96767 type:complete len:185 (-) Transcript_29138:31-585(-)
MAALAGAADFEVTWRPFQLNDAAPGGQGVNKLAIYKEKFGDERVAQMLPMMMGVGQQAGINFSYGGNTGNTFDSHRLIALAAKQGKQDEVVEVLFRSYFEKERCISDRAVLLEAAAEAGVVGAAEMLEGDGETDEVRMDVFKYAFGMGVTGVPHFIIDGNRQAHGALESTQFQEIFRDILDGEE